MRGVMIVDSLLFKKGEEVEIVHTFSYQDKPSSYVLDGIDDERRETVPHLFVKTRG